MLLTKGVNPGWRQEAAEYSKTQHQWEVLLGPRPMEQPFQSDLRSWANLEMSFPTYALQLRVKTIGPDHLFLTWSCTALV